jgi:hypothetical protein
MRLRGAGVSRRAFLGAAGAVAAAGVLGRAAVPATRGAKGFEVGIAVYAWDLHDEGVEKVLDNLQLAAVNSVYILGEMHPEKRPATTAVFPHNPVRKTWMAEDSRVYWHPEFSRYGRIKPLLSANGWLNETDWVETLSTAARKRGLSPGVEISHSLVDRARAEGALADCAQRDIQGNISRNHFRPACMNHPDVRAYILALYTELAERYDVDLVMSANIPFDEGGPATGGCFCDSCVKAAAAENFDLAAARVALLADPAAEPHATRWRRFRCTCTAALYKEIRAAVHGAREKGRIVAPADFRFSLFMTKRNPGDWGVDLSLMREAVDSIRVQEYSEDTGDAKILETKGAYLREIARQLRPTAADGGFRINSAIGVRPKATAALIARGIAIAKECGMSGITLSQYDGADLELLKAVRAGLAAVGLAAG